MKKIAVLALLFLFFASFAAVYASGDESDKDCRIGDRVNVGAITVQVFSFAPYHEKNSVMVEHFRNINKNKPMKYFVAELMILNASRSSYEYNAYQFVLLDSDEEEYQWCISTKEPKFEGKTLKPGMMGKGFLVYGIPENVTPSRIVFDPGYVYDGVVNFYIDGTVK